MKQNKNTDAFFELVKAGLWEADCQLTNVEDIDFSVVYRLSEEQSVTGLVTAGLEHIHNAKIPQEKVLDFIGTALQLEQKNKAMNAFLSKLIEGLRKESIYTLLLKGQGIAQCYERPLWRACGDLDLFLSDDNYEKAKRSLSPKATYVEQEGVYNKHIGMTIDSWTVELHGNLKGGLSSKVDKELDDIRVDTFYGGKVRSWMNGNTQVFLLGVENDIVYVFAHYLAHFYKGGVGLRQICDWCRLLWTYREKINVSIIEKRLKRMGVMLEWKAFGVFAVQYLGMPVEAMPFYTDNSQYKEKAARIKTFVLKVGNFGHNRDMSYFQTRPYLVRKTMSLGRRTGDLMNHLMIFPLDTLRFFPRIMYNGLMSVANGE